MVEKSPDEMFSEIYDDLHRLARWLMEQERQGHTLQPTALLGEVWIKLFSNKPSFEGADRAELISRATTAMRQILIDHSRGRNAEKRGRDYRRHPLIDEILDRRAAENIDVLELEDALSKLAESHPRPAQAMGLRVVGFADAEIAPLLGFSQETIRKDLLLARAWLSRRLGGGPRNGS